MVCIYCGHETQVVNSRLQKRTNTTWRRRTCTHCGSIFTSIESVAYATAISIKYDPSHIMPFQRDTIFISIYEACRHRKHAVTDASALTATVLGKLQKNSPSAGIIERDYLVELTGKTLKAFDPAAAVYYQAYHPLPQ